jgi:hypothetical protein
VSTDNGNPQLRRVLVIGGKEKNIPSWAYRAFNIDLIQGDHQGGNRLLDPARADAIVVQVNWVSHNFSGQAHDLGRQWGVPVLKARDGWSSAVEHAARNRLDWFVDGVQLGGQRLMSKNAPRAKEALEVVDNAWKALAEVEREKADHAQRRVGQQERQIEKLEGTVSRMKSGMQERILNEIRRRANEVKLKRAKSLAPLLQEIRTMREEASALTARLEQLESWVTDAVNAE